MTTGIFLDLNVVAPGHTKVEFNGAVYLVTLQPEGRESETKVLVLCTKKTQWPWQCAQYTRTIKPFSQNWRRALVEARKIVLASSR